VHRSLTWRKLQVGRVTVNKSKDFLSCSKIGRALVSEFRLLQTFAWWVYERVSKTHERDRKLRTRPYTTCPKTVPLQGGMTTPPIPPYFLSKLLSHSSCSFIPLLISTPFSLLPTYYPLPRHWPSLLRPLTPRALALSFFFLSLSRSHQLIFP